jgi:hypothetical protein
MDKLFHEIFDTVLAFLITLLPPALGAGVSMLVDDAITWTKMLSRLLVGILVCYFVRGAVDAILSPHPVVSQAIGFMIGMVAYKAAPGFISGTSAVIAELPGQLRDRLLALFPRKDSK